MKSDTVSQTKPSPLSLQTLLFFIPTFEKHRPEQQRRGSGLCPPRHRAGDGLPLPTAAGPGAPGAAGSPCPRVAAPATPLPQGLSEWASASSAHRPPARAEARATREGMPWGAAGLPGGAGGTADPEDAASVEAPGPAKRQASASEQGRGPNWPTHPHRLHAGFGALGNGRRRETGEKHPAAEATLGAWDARSRGRAAEPVSMDAALS